MVSKNSLKANPKKFQTFGLASRKSPVDSRSKWQIQNLNKKTVLNKLLGVTTDNKLTSMDTLLAYAAKLVDK